MASRSISAILWTLVSVNVITLVVGGLITWLGYAIPVRLKQFGLLPGLVIVAGFASLVVACIGLCALNYSSHHALNIYGISCLVFVMMLVFGIPENWYKSHQFGEGSLLMDIIYFSLVIVLVILLVFAFTFAQYLRRKQLAHGAIENGLHLGGSGYDSPHNCSSCNLHHHCHNTTMEIDPNDRSHFNSTSSFIDKWSSWAGNHTNRNNNNNNNLDAINLASRNNCCHLAHRQSPVQTLANHYQQIAAGGRGCSACNGGHNYQRPVDQSANTLPVNPAAGVHSYPPPLISKGFYQSSGSGLTRAKSFNQPLNEQQQQDDDLYDKMSYPSRASECRTGWANRIYRSSSSNQCLAQAESRDDSFVHYGRGHILNPIQQHYQLPMSSGAASNRHQHNNNNNNNNHHHHHHHHHSHNHGNQNLNAPQINRTQYNVPKCSCHLNNTAAIPLNHSITSSLAYRRYLNNDLAFHTMPRLNSSSYAAKFKPKIRSKGSSSVVAMTAAAAAALLGGVADTCSVGPNESDGLFAGAGDEITVGDGDADGCNFDNNDHQLNVSMLADTTSNIHQNGCREPVLDFAPLLDFRKP